METQNVVAVCAGGELMKNMLPHLLEQLELCQKSLSAYLETKRAEFPRCGADSPAAGPATCARSGPVLSGVWMRESTRPTALVEPVQRR
jgi:hypothetical protein